MSNQKYFSGLTWRTLGASVLGVMVMAVLMQLIGAIDASARTDWLGRESVPVTAVMVVLVYVGISGLMFLISKKGLFSRPELICIFYIMLLAAPLMHSGFWRNIYKGVSSAREEGYVEYDSLRSKLWPHGKNLSEGVFETPEGVEVLGNVQWEERILNSGETQKIPVLRNQKEEEVSAVRLILPVLDQGSGEALGVGEPHLVAVLAKGKGLGAGSNFYARFYVDDHPVGSDLFERKVGEKVDYLHPEGFIRLGKYGVDLPKSARERVILEVGLRGAGEVAFHDVDWFNVSALESAYTGLKVVERDFYERLPLGERAGLVVKPESWFSVDGLRYVFIDTLHLDQWWQPIVAWAVYAILLLVASFGVGSLMRQQWIDRERYPMPLTQITTALFGDPEEGEQAGGAFLSRIWKNPFMWGGFGVAILYGGSQLVNAYYADIPSLDVNMGMKSYFSDASLGAMWKRVNFDVSLLGLAFGLFMEVNILLSIVVGFLFFRCQFWFAEAYGYSADKKWVHGGHQRVGGVLAYFFLTVFFTRKYLWKVIKNGLLKGESGEGEVMSYRQSFALIAVAFGGLLGWAWWVGLPATPMLAVFGYFLLLLIVFMKFRVECGEIGAQPIERQGGAQHEIKNVICFAPFLGGMGFLGGDSYLFMTLASSLFMGGIFVLVPGMQFELMEMARRYRVKRWHIIGTWVLGIGLGLFFGGWSSLLGAYSFGIENFPVLGPYKFSQVDMEFFNSDLNEATRLMTGGEPAEGISNSAIGILVGGIVTGGITILRQIFAGFWFHPVGYLISMTEMVTMNLWSSFAVALVIRYLVLKLGGAVTVREKLYPFATGLFLGTVGCYVLMIISHAYMFFFSSNPTRFDLLF